MMSIIFYLSVNKSLKIPSENP